MVPCNQKPVFYLCALLTPHEGDFVLHSILSFPTYNVLYKFYTKKLLYIQGLLYFHFLRDLAKFMKPKLKVLCVYYYCRKCFTFVKKFYKIFPSLNLLCTFFLSKVNLFSASTVGQFNKIQL